MNRNELKQGIITGFFYLSALALTGCLSRTEAHTARTEGGPATGRLFGTPPPNIPRYPPPATKTVAMAWKQQGFWRLQRPGDPSSPRFVIATTGPKYNVYSFDAAITDFEKDLKVTFAQRPKLEPLESWKNFDGTDMRLALVPTRYGNIDGVFFFVIAKKPNNKEYILNGMEMTDATFRQWGGIARMLVLQEGLQSPELYPKERREAIANAPLPRQVAIYEASLNALYANLAGQMMAMSQAQVLLRMRELNYDLLLGKNITNPNIGN